MVDKSNKTDKFQSHNCGGFLICNNKASYGSFLNLPQEAFANSECADIAFVVTKSDLSVYEILEKCGDVKSIYFAVAVVIQH